VDGRMQDCQWCGRCVMPTEHGGGLCICYSNTSLTRLFRFLGKVGALHVKAEGCHVIDGRIVVGPPPREGIKVPLGDGEWVTITIVVVPGDLAAAAMVRKAAASRRTRLKEAVRNEFDRKRRGALYDKLADASAALWDAQVREDRLADAAVGLVVDDER